MNRVEDLRLLTGKGIYVDDIHLPGQVGFLGIIRSPYAHAKISSISFEKAKANPELVSFVTGEELELVTAPITERPIAKSSGRRHLAFGKVRFVGEPVAAIVVSNKYAIEDIADQVEVEYEPLPVVKSIADSKSGHPLIYEDWGNNCSFVHSVSNGDTKAAFASAAHVIKTRIGIRRQAGVPIEPRAYMASYDKNNDRLLVYATSQSAHTTRAYLSNELKIPQEKIHVIVNDVGGGFGTKSAQSYSETLLCAYFAKKTGFNVRWTSTRTEDLLETASGRDQYCDIELACDSNGHLQALRADIELDAGVSGTLSTFPMLTSGLLPGPYVIPNILINASCWVTNKPPIGPVRGAGRPEATFFMERAIDNLARQIGMDALELRKRNIINPDKFPYKNGAGLEYDSANFPLLIDTITRLSGYPATTQKIASKVDISEKLTGVGMCLEIEDTGALLKESAKVIADTKMVQVFTGSSPHGQGLETSLAQLASQELGIPIEKIKVVYGDTRKIPVGIGTFGSRSLVTGGSSVIDSSRKLRSQVITESSKLFGLPASRITIDDGQIVDVLQNRQLIDFFALIERVGGKLEVSSDYAVKAMPFSSGAHYCSLSIDIETGKVSIQRYIAVDDCGNVVNHSIVEGQVEGGVIHGLGGSLLEELAFDDEGQPLTANMLDYLIPTSLDIPAKFDFESVMTPSPFTPNGAKGVGESGTIAAHPTIFNAINNALAKIGVNDEINIAPATPETIFKAIRNRQGSHADA